MDGGADRLHVLTDMQACCPHGDVAEPSIFETELAEPTPQIDVQCRHGGYLPGDAAKPNISEATLLDQTCTAPQVQEELPDVPLYYSLHDMCRTVKCQPCKRDQFMSAIINAGYR